MKNYYTLEYSPTQKCFHYDQIFGMVKNNIDICTKETKENPCYVCLGIFETEQERDMVKNGLEGLFGTVKL